MKLSCVPLGTFAPEGDKVIYGLTKPVKTFEILSIQVSLFCILMLKVQKYSLIFVVKRLLVLSGN